MVKGLIYKCECTKTHKCYIGQTTRSLDWRKNQHIRKSFIEGSVDYECSFHRAIRKYGPDNFKWSIVVTLQADCENELAESLNELEWYYIKKHNSYINGYNMTRGGDSNSIKPARTVIQYDVTGEKLNEFDSVDDAASILNIHFSTIKQSINKNLHFVKKGYNRFVFRYDGESYTKEEIIHNLKSLNNENIYVFNMNGEIMEICLNLGKFAEKYKIKINQARHCLSQQTPYLISNVCPEHPIIISRGKKPQDEQLKHVTQFYKSSENRSRFYTKVVDNTDGSEQIYSNLSKLSRTLNLNYRYIQRQLGVLKKDQIQINNYTIINMKYYG